VGEFRRKWGIAPLQDAIQLLHLAGIDAAASTTDDIAAESPRHPWAADGGPNSDL
jgi:hypothetical protein